MFNNKLKDELAQLRNELASMRQVKDSLYSEMLVLEIEADGRVLEMDREIPSTGERVRMWDTRTRDRVHQRQHSRVDIEELDAAGTLRRTHQFETTQRWVYRFELELLLREAGFARREILGGWAREPFTRDDQPMLACGWRD